MYTLNYFDAVITCFPSSSCTVTWPSLYFGLNALLPTAYTSFEFTATITFSLLTGTETVPFVPFGTVTVIWNCEFAFSVVQSTTNGP